MNVDMNLTASTLIQAGIGGSLENRTDPGHIIR